MSNVTVPALKPLLYQGRSYVRGEMVTMPAIDAAAHAHAGDVELGKGVVITRDVVAEDTEQTPVKTRRRYRRRDMTAEATPE